MFVLPQASMESWEHYVHYTAVFDAEECRRIIALHEHLEMGEARISGEVVNDTIRRSHTGWIHFAETHRWLFERLTQVVTATQQHWYPFSLTGFTEPLQLTRYTEAQKGHYDMHRDMGMRTMSTRKLSLVVLLSDPSEYDGGALEILGASQDGVPQNTRGTVIAFPAWEMHRVQPVTRGTRWSLVVWVHGPRFT